MFNENDLVSKILAGDLHAFGRLVSGYEKLVFNIVNRVIDHPEDVEDVCQEVFIKVYKGLRGFAFQSKLSTWIASIAHRTALNELKKNGRKGWMAPLEEPVHLLSGEDDPEKAVIRKDVSLYIQQLIEQMPSQYSLVITLFHIHEFSYQEIEEITGMPSGTVKGYLFRARKLLKEKLEGFLKKETI